MIDFNTWSTPNGRKISIVPEEVGLSYRRLAADIAKGLQFKPDLLKIGPNNRIPAIGMLGLGNSVFLLNITRVRWHAPQSAAAREPNGFTVRSTNAFRQLRMLRASIRLPISRYGLSSQDLNGKGWIGHPIPMLAGGIKILRDGLRFAAAIVFRLSNRIFQCLK